MIRMKIFNRIQSSQQLGFQNKCAHSESFKEKK